MRKQTSETQEVKEHVQGHTATEEKRLGLNLGLHGFKLESFAVATLSSRGERMETLVLLILHLSPPLGWSVVSWPSPSDPQIWPLSEGLENFGGARGKELPANAGDTKDVGSIPGLGRSPGGGHGNPLHISCLENPIGLRRLASYFPQSLTESDLTEAT